MKAHTIHYNSESGIATAEPYPGGEKFTVTEDAVGLRLQASDDVAVRVDGDLTRVETLANQPLLVRVGIDGTLIVRTVQRVEAADAGGPPKP